MRDSVSGRGESKAEQVRLVVEATDGGVRLDRFLTSRLAGCPEVPDGLSRSRVQALIQAGSVSGARGKLFEPGAKVKPGEPITVELPPPEAAEPKPESIPLEVVFEDRHLIVIDKPAGLVVHPGAGHGTGTVVNALLSHCGDTLSGIGGVKRPGIVHRLDKDTSGLLIAAKTDAAHRGLAAQFASHGADGRLSRRYLALVWGVPKQQRGRIAATLARSRTNRTRIGVVPDEAGRHAVTHFKVLETYDDPKGKPVASLLECELETGRTHQIRVHVAHIGHPIIGDATYGAHFAASARRLSPASQAALAALGRQALHATHLGFEHPVTREKLRFDRPLPADMADLVAALAT
jgi:23S rRNA pseudouridine1911/1915/1917 synthase